MKKITSVIAKVTKSDFVRVSAWSALSTIIKMITGFVSVKVVARIIGPPGMALVGQFLNAITMISTLGTGCINMGVTKYIAEYHDDPPAQKRVISNAIRITLLSTLVMSVLVILFSRPLGKYIFKTDQYTSLIIILGASIGLYSINLLIVSILNGFKQYRKYVLVNIISSVAALGLSIVLVLNWGLYGALLNGIASQSVIIIVTLCYVYKEEWVRSLFNFSKTKIDRGVIKKLGAFTLMTLVSGLMVPLTQFAIRSNIADNISLHAAGLWEATTRMSSMYLLVVTTSISTFYLPRLSELKQDWQISHEIRKTAKLVLPVLLLACVTIYLSRDIVIRILFSKEFLPMRDLFAFQMVGDFLKMASWLVAFLFWAKAMTKTFIITEILFNLSFIVFAKIGVYYFGVEGSVYGYALNYFLYTITIIIIFRRLLFMKK